jgi:DNA polymerase-3 subunit delta'
MMTLKSLWGQALQQERLYHAYLLVGEGAEWVAQTFVMQLLCESGQACRQCPHCQKLRHGSHPDVRRVTRSGKRIGIDQVRELQKDARYPPLEASYKIYVLEEAESLSPEAANSLLKILEDPPEYIVFLLLARSLQLLPTILSRCQVLKLRPPSDDELRESWQAQGYSSEEIEYLLALTRGTPRRLTQLLVDPLEEPLKRREEVRQALTPLKGPQIVEFLAQTEDLIAQREAALQLWTQLGEHASKPHERLELAQALSKLDPEKLEFTLQEALRWYRDLLFLTQAPATANNGAQIFNSDRLEELQGHQASIDGRKARQAVEALERTLQALQGNANVQLLAESLLFRLP